MLKRQSSASSLPTPNRSAALGKQSISNPWSTAALFAMWTYLLSPLAFYVWLNRTDNLLDTLFVFTVVTSSLWLALAFFAVRRPFVLHLALAPLYVMTATNLFLLGTFGARLSSGYVTIILTDHADAREFFATYASSVTFAAIILCVVYLPGLYALHGMRRQRSPRLACLAAALLVIAYAAAIGRSIAQGADTKLAVLDVASHEYGAPVGAVFQTALAVHLHRDTSELRRQRDLHSFGVTTSSAVPGEVYVWVIGESARPDNWSLFGYSRDTTPQLRAIPGIIPLRNMLTTAPHTAVAVPSMLSLRPITDWRSVVSQKTIVGAFNEAGFKTYWLSAQAADSWAGIIPQAAAEAKRRRYFDDGHDGALLIELRQVLSNAAKGEKLFIVLHTKGSHFEYSRRYPPEFARFATANATRRQRLVDAYDNSILYTDWLLSEIISTLSRRDAPSTLVYASDHGENLLDDENQLLGHAIGSGYDLRTAALVWFSDSMRRDHANQVANVHRHADAPLSLSNLPQTVLDMAGIDARGLNRSLSVASSDFVTLPRWYMVRGDLRKEAVLPSAEKRIPP